MIMIVYRDNYANFINIINVCLFFYHSWTLVRMVECQTYVKLSEEKLIPK